MTKTPVTILVIMLATRAVAQSSPYPHNAVACERCHSIPSTFGSSPMTVQRKGQLFEGRFVAAAEGGIHHRNGESAQALASRNQIFGERISLSLLGDGYIEAIDTSDIEKNANRQPKGDLGIAGVVVRAPVLEGGREFKIQTGRYGWKSQHSSLMSSCADSLRNELGIRNRLYPDEYPTHAGSDDPTPFDSTDPKTGETELESLVGEIRRTVPPARDSGLVSTPDALAGEYLFNQIGCAICHTPTYKTLPAGTRINGDTYRVPKFIGNKIIHPYSDFLLHDVGTGDGIPEAAKPEFLDQSTANKFRTPPLWGVRFRLGNLMHDGDTPGTDAAMKRHGGEAAKVRDRYEQLNITQKKQLQTFLNSL